MQAKIPSPKAIFNGFLRADVKKRNSYSLRIKTSWRWNTYGNSFSGGFSMWGIVVALISGALMSIQGVFNTEVTKQSSIWAAAGWVQLTAFFTCVVLYFCTGRGEIQGMFSVERKYMLLGGVMGAFITWTVIKSMDGLGPAKATLLIVVTQILVSYLVEVFGMFGVEKAGFEWRKLAGAAVAIAGIVMFHWQKG